MLGTVMKAAVQMWGSLMSWFTPTVLFVLMNVVIGTIAITSGMRQNNNANRDLRRSPSLFNRLSSFSFRADKVEEIAETEDQEEEEKMENNVVIKEEKPEVKMAEESKSKVEANGTSEKTQKKKLSMGLGRSKSDTPPIADFRPPPLPSKLKKSGTFESAFNHFDFQSLEVLETTREVVTRVESDENGPEDAAEVDAKADDFINKFKQQLKLQRLESIMRYKDMINRGK